MVRSLWTIAFVCFLAFITMVLAEDVPKGQKEVFVAKGQKKAVAVGGQKEAALIEGPAVDRLRRLEAQSGGKRKRTKFCQCLGENANHTKCCRCWVRKCKCRENPSNGGCKYHCRTCAY